ncbi:MAG: PD40 domain-containing protein, partial [Chlorobi bacterium]|nr:PD40 domain-containing protein [Chlorobiota bacterium]
LPGSKPGRDSILLNSGHVYCLQTGEYTVRPPGYSAFPHYSPDGKYIFELTGGDIHHPNGRFFLNGVEFYLSHPVGDIGQASWSPDGSKIALAVWPGDVPTVEIWIFHIDEYLAGESDTMPMHAINLEDQFCFYGGAIYPEYATDSTLIVAMHRDGDEFSGLWEISDKAGDTYKRSLTS